MNGDKPSSMGNGLNTNSLITAIATFIILGVVGWVGKTSSDNSDQLTSIRVAQPYVQQAISRLEAQISGLVTRAELDSKFAELKVEQTKMQIDLLRMKKEALAP